MTRWLLLLLLLAPCHADGLRRVWTVPAPNLRALALSPDGASVAIVTDIAPHSGREKLSLWHWRTQPQTPAWTRPAPAVNFVEVGIRGDFLLTAARLAPSHPFASVRQGTDGAEVSRIGDAGGVWDMAIAPGGHQAAGVTGNRALFLVTLDGDYGVRRVPLAGVGNSVAYTGEGRTVAVGTWDTGGVQTFNAQGAPLWQWTQKGVGAAQVAAANQSVLALIGAGMGRVGPTLAKWPARGSGQPAWQTLLPPDARDVRAVPSGDGQWAAVSFVRWPAKASVPQRRVWLVDCTNGKRVWERGSFLFSPTLLAVSADGSHLFVSDGKTTLYALDAAGRVASSYNVGARILDTRATPDGRFLLVSTGRGDVSLLAWE